MIDLQTSLDIVHRILDENPQIIPYVENIINKNRGFSYDFNENGEEDLLQRVANVNPITVFDVGANVGSWSLIAHRLFPNATIHCFELSRTTFETLKNNIGHIPFVLNNVGLADKTGVFEYKDYGTNSGVNTILLDQIYHDKNTQPKIEKATLLTGAEYCQSNNISHIDFMKIDVEGAEHLVLSGFSDLLVTRSIRVIQFEYGYVNGDSKYLMRDFHRFFNGCGYIVARIQKGPIFFKEWTYKDNDFMSGPNYVAIREDDTDLIRLLSN